MKEPIYNEKIGAYQIKVGDRMRRVEKKNCIICGDDYWYVIDWQDRGYTCGKNACVQVARMRTRHSKLREQ